MSKKYFIGRLSPEQSEIELEWRPCRAGTVQAACRAATKGCLGNSGAQLFVGVKEGGSPIKTLARRADIAYDKWFFLE